MHKDSLKKCIASLEKVRHATNSQLDARVLQELDTVIAELKRLGESHKDVIPLGTLSGRTLKVLGQVIELVSNFTDLM